MMWLLLLFATYLIQLCSSFALPSTEPNEFNNMSWEELVDEALGHLQDGVEPSVFEKLKTVKIGGVSIFQPLTSENPPDNAYITTIIPSEKVMYDAWKFANNVTLPVKHESLDKYTGSFNTWTYPDGLEGTTYKSAFTAVSRKYPAANYAFVEVGIPSKDPFIPGQEGREILWLFTPVVSIRDVWKPSTGDVGRFTLEQLGITPDSLPPEYQSVASVLNKTSMELPDAEASSTF